MMFLCVFEDFADVSPMRKKAKKLRVNMARKSLLVYFPDAVKCNDLTNLCNIFGVIGRRTSGVPDNRCAPFMSFLMMKN